MSDLAVLFEDNHLLVLNKPAGLPTMGVAPDEESLFTLAQDYIRDKYHKPGKVYLGVVSRLDAFVSGVIVFARTSKAAARLTDQFKTRDVEKIYWAIVAGSGLPAAGQYEDWLAKNEGQHRMEVVAAEQTGAQLARLSFRKRSETDRETQLELKLETGRKHQIRVQLAHRGHPIVGDRKYDSARTFPRGIALHSRALTLQHPVTKAELKFVADLPDYWPKFA